MKDFELLYSEFETMDSLKYEYYLTETAKGIIPILNSTAEDGINGPTIFYYFILSTMSIDGRLSEEEYKNVYPILYNLFENSVKFDDCKKQFKKARKNPSAIQHYSIQMSNILMLLSDELKEDLIIVLFLLCSVSKKITPKEKNWIKQLILN